MSEVRATRFGGVGIRRLLLYVLLSAIAVIMVGPFAAMISVSFQARPILGGADWFTPNLTLKNYVTVFTDSDLPRWFLNSTIITVVVTTVGTFLSSMSGYVFAKLSFPGKNLLFLAFISVLMFPVQSWIVTMFVEFSKLHMVNTFWPFFLSGSSSAFGIFLIRQYVTQAVPNEILDAADMDGCSELGKFLRIAVPMITPGITTLAIMLFISWWSEFLFALVMVNSDTMYTISVGVTVLQGVFANTGGMRPSMAATVIAQVPLLVIYLIFNRYVMRGVAVEIK